MFRLFDSEEAKDFSIAIMNFVIIISITFAVLAIIGTMVMGAYYLFT